MQSAKLETLADCAAIFPRLELPSGRGFKGGNETNETETKTSQKWIVEVYTSKSTL